MTAYYNEIDPYAAQWLRNLIAAGHIAPGDVDERSILDVRPDDLRRYTQCHFFAGIGVWSYALRRAGWADDRPVWTGSCPCQPFSAAGKGGGFDDERHLWPAFNHLIGQCRPGVVLGEQVASKDGLAWLDLVQADLEGAGYASGAVDLCAAGVGAPHIRQRLWWVGERLDDAAGARHVGPLDGAEGAARDEAQLRLLGAGSGACWMDDDDDPRLEGQRGGHRAALGYGQGSVRPTSPAGQSGGLGDAERLGAGRDGGAGAEAQGGAGLRPERHDAGSSGAALGLADADGGAGEQGRQDTCRGDHRGDEEQGAGFGGGSGLSRPGPTNGLWRAADWLFCRDGKWRPVEPGTFPLAHGAPARVGRLRADQERLAALLPRKDQGSRVGRLRGYGNAVNAEAAVAFIEAVDHAIGTVDLRLSALSEMTKDIGGIFA